MSSHYYEYPNGEVHKLSFTPGEHSEAVRLPQAEGKAKRAEYCRRKLKETLKPGDTVYCVLRHESRSGMQCRIDLFTFKKNKPVYLSAYAADLIGWALHSKGGVVVDGYGMDMGSHLVYELGASMWPKGTRRPHSTRNGEPDRAGGYALSREWL